MIDIFVTFPSDSAEIESFSRTYLIRLHLFSFSLYEIWEFRVLCPPYYYLQPRIREQFSYLLKNIIYRSFSILKIFKNYFIPAHKLISIAIIISFILERKERRMNDASSALKTEQTYLRFKFIKFKYTISKSIPQRY